MAEHRFSSVNGIHIESRRGVFGNKTNIPSMAKTFFFAFSRFSWKYSVNSLPLRFKAKIFLRNPAKSAHAYQLENLRPTNLDSRALVLTEGEKCSGEP